MIQGSEISAEERELIPWILSPAFSGGIVDSDEVDKGTRFVKFANEGKDYKIFIEWITKFKPLKRSERKVKFLKLERAVMAVMLKHCEDSLRNEVLKICRSENDDDDVKPSTRLLNMWKKIRAFRKWLRKQKQIFRSREYELQNQALDNKNIPEPPDKLIRINSNESRRGQLSRRMRIERPSTFEELERAILNRCEFLLRSVNESAVDFGGANAHISSSEKDPAPDTLSIGLKPPSPLRRQRSFDGVMSVLQQTQKLRRSRSLGKQTRQDRADSMSGVGNDEDEISHLENELQQILMGYVKEGGTRAPPSLIKSLLSRRNNRCRARTLGVRSAIALLDVLDIKHKNIISSARTDVLTPLRDALDSSRTDFRKNRRSVNMDENDQSDNEEEKRNDEDEEDEDEEESKKNITSTRSSRYRIHSPLNPFSSHTMTSARHHVECDLEGCTQKILKNLRDAFESFTSRLVRFTFSRAYKKSFYIL